MCASSFSPRRGGRLSDEEGESRREEEGGRERERRRRREGEYMDGQARLKTCRQLLRGIMRNPVNAPVSGHHSTASLTLGSIGMQ